MDLSQISAILSLEPDATSIYAIGRLGLAIGEMIELADSCALSSFCCKRFTSLSLSLTRVT
jgi:hypothetical protein